MKMEVNNPGGERRSIEEMMQLFTIKVNADAKRYEFTRKEKGIGYIVSFSECKTERKAWLAVNFAEQMRIEKNYF